MSFTDSSIDVWSDDVKGLIFRTSVFIMYLLVLQAQFLIAYWMEDYLLYLITYESGPQKLLFCLVRRRGQIITIIFTLFYLAAYFYGNILRAMDRPGKIEKASLVHASEVQAMLNPSVNSVVHIRGNPGLSSNTNFVSEMSQDLWIGGERVLLTGNVNLGTAHVLPQQHWSKDLHPGPRIWLDDEGWSVSLDYNPSLFCATSYNGQVESWNCPFDMNGPRSSSYLRKTLARPTAWWNMLDDDAGQWETSSFAEHGGNPWVELGGARHETVAMHQILTVTKGKTRQVFLLSGLKVNLLGNGAGNVHDNDIVDLIQRTWSQDVPLNITLESVTAEVLAKLHIWRGPSSENRRKHVNSLLSAQWDELFPHTMVQHYPPSYGECFIYADSGGEVRRYPICRNSVWWHPTLYDLLQETKVFQQETPRRRVTRSI